MSDFENGLYTGVIVTLAVCIFVAGIILDWQQKYYQMELLKRGCAEMMINTNTLEAEFEWRLPQ